MTPLAVVTATIDPRRAVPFVRTWMEQAAEPFDLYLVAQGELERGWFVPLGSSPKGHRLYSLASQEILGVVPAFARGVAEALNNRAEIIACLHDDMEIETPGWDQVVLNLFAREPTVGLAGFGGALGLGSDDIYQTPYTPMQLVRHTFLSNMRHAEAHGGRWETARLVACLDGFSQIGRADFFRGLSYNTAWTTHSPDGVVPIWKQMEAWGLVHHAYDAALACFAKRLGWEVALLGQIATHHHGGLTAVADPRYLEWARATFSSHDHMGNPVQGDAALWCDAHRRVYEAFRDCLPIRV